MRDYGHMLAPDVKDPNRFTSVKYCAVRQCRVSARSSYGKPIDAIGIAGELADSEQAALRSIESPCHKA
jgi:hypothetical protein